MVWKRSGLIQTASLLSLAIGAFRASAAPAPAPAIEGEVRRDATVAAVEKVMPCVVNIATETIVEYEDFYQRLFRDFFGQRSPSRQQRELSVGSGVIIDEDGYVLTNLHVVRRANRTQVKLWDGREYEAVPIVATTHSDVALLKIRSKPGEKFKAVHFAADDDLMLGETVLALGNPFGLGGSVTKGILSSKSRRPATGNEPLDVQDWLQTDAAINPGNSGGPLVNIRGDLIGLNVAVYREGQGIGFAIPVKQVSEALSSFFTPEVRHGLWFGARLKVGAAPVTVVDVQPNSPAANAGIAVGEHILEVNGHRVESLIQFGDLVSKASDHKVSLTVESAQNRRLRKVSLETVPFKDLIREQTGLTVTELTDEQANRLGLQGGKGLLITEVARKSPAEKAQLRPGFLISELDGQNVEAVMNLGILLSLKQRGDTARFTIVAPRRLGGGYLEFQQGTVDLKIQ